MDSSYGILIDSYNPNNNVRTNNEGSPLSENMTADFIDLGNKQLVFDYNRVVASLQNNSHFPEILDHTKTQSAILFWNLALEFHTGRYYRFMFGSLYILFIPLFGITMLIILISEFC